MTSSLSDMFFTELKSYNSTNFKTLLNANISEEDPKVYKSCSSVVTRYFIFAEKHPEIPQSAMKMLYFKLRIDMLARYFSEYPAADPSDLKPFQDELKRFANKSEDEILVGA